MIALFRILQHYGVVSAGPIALAGSQFVLSVVLLLNMPAEQFGLLAFVLIGSQLSAGLAGALLSAPYPVEFGAASDQGEISRVFLSVNLLLAVVCLLLFWAIFCSMGIDTVTSAMLALYAAIMQLRWFARTYCYVNSRPVRTAISDFVCAAVVMIAAGALVLDKAPTLSAVSIWLCVSALAGILPFGRTFLKEQATAISPHHIGRYRSVWNAYARWSFLGVLTTEITANAHAYLVTFMGGPAAFAPLAATNLVVRPVTIALNALTNYERPRLTALVAAGNDHAVRLSLLAFRISIAAIWLLTVAAAVVLSVYFPDHLYPPDYARDAMQVAIVIWFAISLVRAFRTPESVLIQANGRFRALAQASVVSSLVSVFAVTGLLLAFAPVWSLFGILLGEIVFAWKVSALKK